MTPEWRRTSARIDDCAGEAGLASIYHDGDTKTTEKQHILHDDMMGSGRSDTT